MSNQVTPLLSNSRYHHNTEPSNIVLSRAADKVLIQYCKDLTAVFDLLNAGRLRPEIGEVMQLKEAPKAQQMMQDY
jgi:NADPH:quinone reductase-like Zn-dependent oxidoreductase